MKLATRTTIALTAAFSFAALPAGAALAQESDCEVTQGPGSAVGDVECDDETDVGNETIDRTPTDGTESEDDTQVLPGRIDRPNDGAPAADDEDTTDAAPSVESTELVRTGTDADVALVAALAALTLGGGALVAGKRRKSTES